jgi:hypothetical protein
MKTKNAIIHREIEFLLEATNLIKKNEKVFFFENIQKIIYIKWFMPIILIGIQTLTGNLH